MVPRHEYTCSRSPLEEEFKCSTYSFSVAVCSCVVYANALCILIRYLSSKLLRVLARGSAGAWRTEGPHESEEKTSRPSGHRFSLCYRERATTQKPVDQQGAATPVFKVPHLIYTVNYNMCQNIFAGPSLGTWCTCASWRFSAVRRCVALQHMQGGRERVRASSDEATAGGLDWAMEMQMTRETKVRFKKKGKV